MKAGIINKYDSKVNKFDNVHKKFKSDDKEL